MRARIEWIILKITRILTTQNPTALPKTITLCHAYFAAYKIFVAGAIIPHLLAFWKPQKAWTTLPQTPIFYLFHYPRGGATIQSISHFDCVTGDTLTTRNPTNFPQTRAFHGIYFSTYNRYNVCIGIDGQAFIADLSIYSMDGFPYVRIDLSLVTLTVQFKWSENL